MYVVVGEFELIMCVVVCCLDYLELYFVFFFFCVVLFFLQAEDGIRDLVRSRGLGDVYKRQPVVLVSDWFNESDFPTNGFSEAAADALYSALARLNFNIGGNKLVLSLIHI